MGSGASKATTKGSKPRHVTQVQSPWEDTKEKTSPEPPVGIVSLRSALPEPNPASDYKEDVCSPKIVPMPQAPPVTVKLPRDENVRRALTEIPVVTVDSHQLTACCPANVNSPNTGF